MKDLIYICTNNGSDTRISKEIRTFSGVFRVHYIGIRSEEDMEYRVLDNCCTVSLITGGSRNINTMGRFLSSVRRLSKMHPSASVHIVQEELVLLVKPFLLRKHLILDIFDSKFLRINKSGNKFLFLKMLVYGAVNGIVVTDEDRKSLMPDRYQFKTSVVGNYPEFMKLPDKSVEQSILTIGYFGSLAARRGGEFLEKLLAESDYVHAICAGWLYDAQSEMLTKHERVKYLGIVPQADVLSVMASSCDYILMIYPLDNTNNINASPNKLYDAMLSKTPVIVNSGVNVAKLVKSQNIGVVLDDYNDDNFDYCQLLEILFSGRNTLYSSTNAPVWEDVSSELIAMHSHE